MKLSHVMIALLFVLLLSFASVDAYCPKKDTHIERIDPMVDCLTILNDSDGGCDHGRLVIINDCNDSFYLNGSTIAAHNTFEDFENGVSWIHSPDENAKEFSWILIGELGDQTITITGKTINNEHPVAEAIFLVIMMFLALFLPILAIGIIIALIVFLILFIIKRIKKEKN